MILAKLQKLAEAGENQEHKIGGVVKKAEMHLEDAFTALVSASRVMKSKELLDGLKDTSEAREVNMDIKSAIDSVKSAIEAFNDFQNGLNENINEADEKPYDPRAEQAKIDKIMRTVEPHLEHECRYKSWDADAYEKTIDWVTQESSPEQSKVAARTIAKILRKAGVAKGFTVRVVVRDDYSGTEMTKWHAKVKV